MKAFYLIVSLFFSTSFLLAQPRLLKDTNDEANGGTEGSFFGSNMRAVELNGRMYFPVRNNSSHIFSTDGTAAGTSQFAEPSTGYINVDQLAVLNGSLLISESSFIAPPQLWTSDGISAPVPVAQVTIGFEPIVVDNVLYFTFDDGVSGEELWRTDGTEEGTRLVKDIAPGATSSVAYDRYFTKVGNTLFFFANDGEHGKELWRSDGTPEGTVLVLDINPGDADAVDYTQPVAIDNDIFFVADDGSNGRQFWKSDGTELGTVMVTDGFGKYADGLYEGVGNKWIAIEMDNDGGYEPFVLDIETGDYSLLVDSHTGSDGPGPSPETILKFNGKIYFASNTDDGFGLWKTDGTTENTEVVTEFQLPDEFAPTLLRSNGELLLLSASKVNYNGDDAAILMVSDGEEFTTIQEIYSVENMYTFGDKFLLNLADGIHGTEPWISDGTEEGTFILKDINTISTMRIVDMASTEDRVVFMNSDGIDTYSLWGSDGTESGTVLLKEGKPFRYFDLLRSNGDKVLFGFDDGEHGGEPWITDGTVAGTFMLKDIFDGSATSLSFNGLRGTWVGNTAYFFTGDSELWKTNGTSEGTVLVTDKLAGATHNITSVVAMNNLAYFLFEDQLWKSDGTDAGTVMIKDVSDNFGANYLVAGNNRMFFISHDVNGYSLWTSDGTANGTHITKDIYVGSDTHYAPIPRFVANDICYFWARQNTDTEKLWRSDGTEQGTYLLKDVGPSGSSYIRYQPWPSGTTIYFTGTDEEHGLELWKTNGTEEGTVMVKDINPGSSSGATGMDFSIMIGDNLYFTGFDNTNFYELWTSDGTQSGTYPLTDYESMFSYVSYSTSPVLMGESIYFTTMEPEHGVEVWVYDVEIVLGLEDFLNPVAVYPNPATNTVNITAPSKYTSIEFKDMLGRNAINTSIDTNTSIDVAHLPRGMYILRMQANDQSVVTKKIILK